MPYGKDPDEFSMKKLRLKEVLKKLLADRGISARELSRATGVPQSNLSSLLSGRGTNKPEQIQAIAEYFGISMEFLLFGESQSTPTLQELLTEEVFEGWLKVKIERAIPQKKKS